jgi:hypothetical protein
MKSIQMRKSWSSVTVELAKMQRSSPNHVLVSRRAVTAWHHHLQQHKTRITSRR